MLRILVVEDDLTIRTMVAEALEDMGYLVETAADGAEALARCGRMASPPSCST